MGRRQEKQEEFSFEDILNEMQSNSNEIECGPYRVKELTMHHQRKNITAGLEPVESPLRSNRLFNEYIIENVDCIEEFGNTADLITVCERPYLINLLRKVTLGDIYKEDDKTYKIYEVKDSDFNIEEKSMSFECGSMTIHLEYPSLSKDNKINTHLSDALNPYKGRRLNDDDYGHVGDIYTLYEILKYISSIEMGDNTIEFDTLSIANRKKFVDKLPLRYIEIIGNFMKKIKEHETKCFTAVNETDPTDTIEIDVASLFVGKNS